MTMLRSIGSKQNQRAYRSSSQVFSLLSRLFERYKLDVDITPTPILLRRGYNSYVDISLTPPQCIGWQRESSVRTCDSHGAPSPLRTKRRHRRSGPPRLRPRPTDGTRGEQRSAWPRRRGGPPVRSRTSCAKPLISPSSLFRGLSRFQARFTGAVLQRSGVSPLRTRRRPLHYNSPGSAFYRCRVAATPRSVPVARSLSTTARSFVPFPLYLASRTLVDDEHPLVWRVVHRQSRPGRGEVDTGGVHGEATVTNGALSVGPSGNKKPTVIGKRREREKNRVLPLVFQVGSPNVVQRVPPIITLLASKQRKAKNLTRRVHLRLRGSEPPIEGNAIRHRMAAQALPWKRRVVRRKFRKNSVMLAAMLDVTSTRHPSAPKIGKTRRRVNRWRRRRRRLGKATRVAARNRHCHKRRLSRTEENRALLGRVRRRGNSRNETRHRLHPRMTRKCEPRARRLRKTHKKKRDRSSSSSTASSSSSTSCSSASSESSPSESSSSGDSSSDSDASRHRRKGRHHSKKKAASKKAKHGTSKRGEPRRSDEHIMKRLQNWKISFAGGDRAKAEMFITRLAKCRAGTSVDDQRLIDAVQATLSGEADLWYRAARPSFKSWERFEGSFRKMFIGRGGINSHLHQLFQLLPLASDGEPSRREQVKIAWNNIRPAYRSALCNRMPRSLKAIQKAGERYEEALAISGNSKRSESETILPLPAKPPRQTHKVAAVSEVDEENSAAKEVRQAKPKRRRTPKKKRDKSEESVAAVQNAPKQTTGPGQQHQATTNTASGAARGNNSRFVGACFTCQETGHRASECPQRRCFRCQETGHLAPQCPRAPSTSCQVCGTPNVEFRNCERCAPYRQAWGNGNAGRQDSPLPAPQRSPN
ncbi:unnamed protein product [Trichogramma brassicae]|uniref:CCHC-type domain-containing protein n=1 Tax=Trichogramma brassicae TaxID=86971 RepID=A0A6H5J801_9HYME|nr:unnamed protein product [Trichogramma brassicae]